MSVQMSDASENQAGEDNELDWMTPERAKFEKGEGNLFFQSPSPKTSKQEGMVDFFDKDNLQGGETSNVQLVVTGIAGIGTFALLLALILG